MTREEFAVAAAMSGYGSKESAEKYTEDNPREDYTDQDFITLYESNHSRWEGVRATKGLYPVAGMNGKTTAFRNGIAGNSGNRQDWN